MMVNEKSTKKLCPTERTAMVMNSKLFRPLIWCAACAQLVEMVTPEAATCIARTAVEKLNQEIENHRLHSMKTQSGALLICLESLTENAFARPEILMENAGL